jgi:hypothetical protein
MTFFRAMFHIIIVAVTKHHYTSIRIFTMYNGIGLSTARGTGTNGYVTTNAAALPKAKRGPIERHQDIKPEKIKLADPEILEHEKKRQIEIKVTKWADEQGLLDAEYVYNY